MDHRQSVIPGLLLVVALATALSVSRAQGNGTDRLARATDAALVDTLLEAATLMAGGSRGPTNATNLTLDGGGQNFRQDGYANHWWDAVTPMASFFDALFESTPSSGPLPAGPDTIRMTSISFWQSLVPPTPNTWNFLAAPGAAQFQLGTTPGSWTTIPGVAEAQLTNPALAASGIANGDTVVFYGTAFFSGGDTQITLGGAQGVLTRMTHGATAFTANATAGDYAAGDLTTP